ncbi:hypothetical protein FLP41_16800 [Paracoccus marcusii]|uniref:hypothetical protein n=1 Tax=Paracoccus marcusii TaxID=59779 RepID=UPI002ED34435|nr:hypothetical protein FLP41_16800 [Paracoccus marcusii]
MKDPPGGPGGSFMRTVRRVSEDQRQDADHDQQADDEDDAGGAADELEHVGLLFVTQDNRKGALLFPARAARCRKTG